MRTITRLFAMSACMILLGAPLAIANQSSEEIAEMRAIVEQLQSEVDAQSEQIEHQGEVIRDARLEQSREDDSRFGASGISSFLQRLEIEGWVAGSWFWNYNNPRISSGPSRNPNANSGWSRNIYPYHSSHNSFQVDQIWFGLEHPIDEENRAGFRFDLVYGATAWNLGNNNLWFDPDDADCNGNFTSCFYVSQAYIQYLIPFTSNGITMKAGRFNTIVGAEVAQTTANFNITRGMLFSVMQPVDHLGLLFDTEWGESGVTTAFGVVNSGLNDWRTDPDLNKGKAILGQLGWSNDTIGSAVSVIWGDDFRTPFATGGPGSCPRCDNHSQGLVDVVLTWDPNEKTSTWLNFDYGWRQLSKTRPEDDTQHGYGVAVAGRYAVTERLGLSSRFEWLADKNGFAGWVNATDEDEETDVFSLTGTADYALTNNLMVRAEVRWDTIRKKGVSDDEFWDRGTDEGGPGPGNRKLKRDQVTTGVELVYEF
ncbi:MAG: porin [Deltaproteobacteria bacterium]|nr:porin [Deltaproteobacteria bacterium]